jgi:hypothetical protein
MNTCLRNELNRVRQQLLAIFEEGNVERMSNEEYKEYCILFGRYSELHRELANEHARKMILR